MNTYVIGLSALAIIGTICFACILIVIQQTGPKIKTTKKYIICMKIKVRLKNKIGSKLLLYPVVAYQFREHDKKTGKELTGKALDEAKKKSPSTIERRRVLVENTSFWRNTPAARIEIIADDKSQISEYKEGDLFEVTFSKL